MDSVQRFLSYKGVFGVGRDGTRTKCLRCRRLVFGLCLGHGGGSPVYYVFGKDEFHHGSGEALLASRPSAAGFSKCLLHRRARGLADKEVSDKAVKGQRRQPEGVERRKRTQARKPKGPEVPKEAESYSRCLRMASPCTRAEPHAYEEEPEVHATDNKVEVHTGYYNWSPTPVLHVSET